MMRMQWAILAVAALRLQRALRKNPELLPLGECPDACAACSAGSSDGGVALGASGKCEALCSAAGACGVGSAHAGAGYTACWGCREAPDGFEKPRRREMPVPHEVNAPGYVAESASVRFQRCWQGCSLPRGSGFVHQYVVHGDVPHCLANCVAQDARASLDGDDFISAAEHADTKRRKEEAAERFQGFWDFACESGVNEGCRSVPERVAEEWIRLEVRANETREEGRQWLLRTENQSTFDESFEAFQARLDEELTVKEQELARIFVGDYLNETQSGQTEDEAFAALVSATEPLFDEARAIRSKAALAADSARKLLEDRQVIDARLDKAEARETTVPEDKRDEYKAEILKKWWAEHAAAKEAHDERLSKELTTATATEDMR